MTRKRTGIRSLIRKSRNRPSNIPPVRLGLEQLEDRVMLAGFGQELENDLVALQGPLSNLLAAGSRVPLVGNRLANDPAAAPLKVFADQKLTGISEKYDSLSAANKNNATAVGNALFEILGPSGTGLIANRNNLVVTISNNGSTIRVTMPFSKSLPNITLGGGFGLGLAGLPFNVTASGGVNISQVLFTQNAVFNFNGNANSGTGAVTGPLNFSATANLIAGTTIQATIGFLKATLTDTGTMATVQFSGLNTVKFDAHVNLLAEATFGGSTQFPSVSANFILNWDTRANVNAVPQGVHFDKVSVGLGEFLTDMIRPIVEKVQLVTSPLQPIVDFLKTPVPGVSDLAEAAGLGQVRVKDLIQAHQAADGVNMNKGLEMALRLAEFIDTINGISPNGDLKINLGNLNLTSNADKLINIGDGSNLDLFGGRNWEEALGELGDAGNQIRDLINRAGGEVQLTFPLITDPVNGAFRLFVGRHADLVILDLSYKLENKPKAGGSIFGIAFGFNGGVNIDAKLRLGYDTYGIQRFIETGDAAQLANGFYVDDSTHFRLSGKLGVFAGAGIVVVSIAIEGGLVIPESNPLNITLNRDVAGNPDNDPTRLHFDEVSAHPDRLFKASGQLNAGVSIVVTVGFNVDTPFGEVLIGFTKEFEIASVTIFDFSSSPDQSSFLGLGGGGGPMLAELNSVGDLTLNMGPNVNKLRGAIAPANGDEDFYVLAEGNRIWVLAYGVAQSFPRSSVKHIYADGGSGNDVIIIDQSVALINSTIDGGVGNDRLEHYGLFSRSEMIGGDGNDVLVGGTWNETLHGGTGDDVLIAGDGNDLLIGNEGNDKLFGGLGDDVLLAGAGDDEIDTGGGKDFGGGAEGADTITIYSGIGSPTLDGGLGAFGDDSLADKLIVVGSGGADLIDLEKSGTGAHITMIDAQGRLDNPIAVGIEQIFIEPGMGADQVTINDLTGTVVKQVVANEKADNAADTVIVNGTSVSDTVTINETADLTPYYTIIDGVPFREIIRTAQEVQFLNSARGKIGPSIWTPNAVGDLLVVNTFAGRDQVAVTSDATQYPGFIPAAGRVQVASGSGSDAVYVRSISSETEILAGAGDDSVLVGTLGLAGGDVSRIRQLLELEGGSGIDTFRFDDRLSTTGKSGTIGAIGFQGAILGFGMRNFVLFSTMEYVNAYLGSGGNRVRIDQENAAGFAPGDPTQSIEVYTGTGADTVNVWRTNTLVFVNGERGLDAVNVGVNGSVQKILGALTVTNLLGFSAVNVDNSADTVARTVILYKKPALLFIPAYNTISGLAPADINLQHRNLSSLAIRAGSGGNTFRIHDTPTSNTPGGLTTTIHTGQGSDQVTVNRTTGALALNAQSGRNSITVGSQASGLSAINGPINVAGLRNVRGQLNENTLHVNDFASTTSHDYLLDRDFVQRLDKARISYQNMSFLNLRAGTQTDHIIVQDTKPPVSIDSSTTINAGGGDDRIDVNRTTGTLFVSAGGYSVIEVGNPGAAGLDNIQGGIYVIPSGAGNFVNLILNDQAATTPQQLDVTSTALGTLFRRSGAADINVFFSPLGSFQWLGGSGGDTVNVTAQPAAGSIFSLGAGDDVLNDGTAPNTLVAGSASETLTVIGGEGMDRLFIRDQGTTTPRRYELGAGQLVGQESRGGVSARPLNSVINDWQTINFEQVESVTLDAGSGGNLFQITGTPAATSVRINAGAGVDTVDVGSSNAAFGAVNSLRDMRGPLALDGQGGLDQVTFNDQGTTTSQNYTLEADQLTRTDVNSVASMAPISFTAFEEIALNGSSGGSTVFVGSTAAGTSTTIYGQPGAVDTFAVGFGANTNRILGPVSVFGQAANNDFAYYYDYTNSTPQTYTLRTSPISSDALLVERLGAVPISFGGLNQVIFFSPLVGGNTTNVQSSPAGVFLNMAVADGDHVTLGSNAPNLGGTLANIKGPVNVASYAPVDTAVTLVLDDSGNADLTPKNVRLTPPVSPTDLGNHIEGFAPKTVFWKLGANSSIALLGGAADETFALTSTAFAPAISIDGGGGVNTLDYSAIEGGSNASPVAWYKGEGNADDAVGGYSGAVVGNVQYAPGQSGEAFSFDGVDSYVQVPNTANLEPSTVSVEAWVNSSVADQPNRYLLAKGANGYVAASYALYTGASGGLSFYVYDLDSGFAVSPDAGAGIWDGTWHHVVGTYDGASVRLYIDGAEVGSGTPAIIPLGYGLPDSNDLFIGAYGGPSPFSFSGLIDEPSIYNEGLSAANVQGLFTSGKSAVANGGVTVNLPLGTATGLTGGIARIQNVIGSAGNDILVGNGGNVLSGGAGRDLLIAGAFAGTLNGGGDDDILIGGTTDYDNDLTALQAIMAEWSSATDYATRVSNLQNGTNGVPILNATTVSSNGGGNTLYGNEGLDFFFHNMDDLDTLYGDPLTEEFVAV